jgi:hypothetical protein
MIDRAHDLPVSKQAGVLRIRRQFSGQLSGLAPRSTLATRAAS